MVRVICASSLGFDDYGAKFVDRNVDGIVYDSDEEYLASVLKIRRMKPAVKLVGGIRTDSKASSRSKIK